LIWRRSACRIVSVALLWLLIGPAVPAQETSEDASELLDALLGALTGFGEVTDTQLQDEVAEIGGVRFRAPVPLEYLSREDARRYLQEVFESEYPPERAAADRRTLVAFDLLPEETDLRALRARLLEENIVGFYDERPGRRRLYAISREHRLTPMNQVVLAHELRHALQDQYLDVHGLLPGDLGDFDDRRMALLCLLEGDATLLMQRFLGRRLPGTQANDADLSALVAPEAALPDTPEVVREQLIEPYLAGQGFAQAVWRSGGWEALRSAWSRPPASTEQVLHPEKYLSGEAPLEVAVGYQPSSGRMLAEGVLGELFTRTLVGNAAAAEGWGGDRYRVWDVSGKTLLVWRSRWDSPRDVREFLDAALARFQRTHGPARAQSGWTVFVRGAWSVALAPRDGSVAMISSDDAAAFAAALHATR